jgi:hypothetical protein
VVLNKQDNNMHAQQQAYSGPTMHLLKKMTSMTHNIDVCNAMNVQLTTHVATMLGSSLQLQARQFHPKQSDIELVYMRPLASYY